MLKASPMHSDRDPKTGRNGDNCDRTSQRIGARNQSITRAELLMLLIQNNKRRKAFVEKEKKWTWKQK